MYTKALLQQEAMVSEGVYVAKAFELGIFKMLEKLGKLSQFWKILGNWKWQQYEFIVIIDNVG